MRERVKSSISKLALRERSVRGKGSQEAVQSTQNREDSSDGNGWQRKKRGATGSNQRRGREERGDEWNGGQNNAISCFPSVGWLQGRDEMSCAVFSNYPFRVRAGG